MIAQLFFMRLEVVIAINACQTINYRIMKCQHPRPKTKVGIQIVFEL